MCGFVNIDKEGKSLGRMWACVIEYKSVGKRVLVRERVGVHEHVCLWVYICVRESVDVCVGGERERESVHVQVEKDRVECQECKRWTITDEYFPSAETKIGAFQ